MWILLGFVIIVILIILVARYRIKSFLNQKVASKGGMLTVYKVLIDGMLNDDNARIIKVTDNCVNLGVINIDGSTILRITQLVDKATVSWKVLSISYGDHILRWEFPDQLDQNEMLKTINAHIEKYTKENIKVQNYPSEA